MKLTSRRKVLWLTVTGAGGLVLVLLLWPARPQPRTLDLRIAGQPQMTNGAMLISIVLSNGTLRTLNIVDDGAGNPFVVLDAGVGQNPPGTIGLGLRVLANTLKLKLAPGAALTNAVRLTNPPPRFRLLAEVRDLASERRGALTELLRLLAVKARLSRPSPQGNGLIMLPASPWIENGNISNMTQNATERLKETPTNGLSQ